MNSNGMRKVVVITGASSGIGRATALEFARQGANVVLAARQSELLEVVAKECTQLGARALGVTTDVRNEKAVQALARRVADQFGRIDVWVNNAGVLLFGRFEDVPEDLFRQTIETNFFGCVHGSRAALEQFRKQNRGVLINMASIAGEVPQPWLSAYVASKFAIVGFTKSLRYEYRDSPIEICMVLPASIDTPIFQHAGNYSGHAVQPLKPVYPPEQAARTIVELAENPQPEAYVGTAAHVAARAHRVAPHLVERMMARQADHDYFQEAPAASCSGNILNPSRKQSTVTGGWRKSQPHRSAPSWTTIGMLALPALAGLLLWQTGQLQGRALQRRSHRFW